MGNETVGVVQYDAIIDTTQLKPDGQKAEKIVEGVGSNIAKTGDRSFKQFAASASEGFGSVADSIQSVVTKVALFAATSSLGIGTFVKSAADLQSTNQSFKVLIGNVDTANGLFAQLARYANTTPFEFPDIAQAGQTLLGFGIQADQVYSRIQTLGDIAAATGADFQSLALVYGQVNAAGKLYGQDALQLINNSVPIYNILAKEMKTDVAGVREQMEKGAITADIFNSALLKTTQQGGFAFEGVTVLANSFNGRMSTLSDTVLEFGRNLIGVKVDDQLGLVVQPGGIFDRLSKALPKIGKQLEQLTPKLTAFINVLLDNGPLILQLLAGLTTAFVFAKVAALGFAAVGALANPFAWIVVAVGAITFLQLRFDIFGKTIRGVQTAISWLTTTFSDGMEQVGHWINVVEQTVVSLYQGALRGLRTGVEAVVSAFNTAKGVVEAVVSAVIGWLYDWRYWIQNIGIVIGTVLLPKLTQVAIQAARTAATTIASFARMGASASVSFAQMAVSATINAAKTTAAWTVSAARTSFVWTTQTLPMMILNFVKMSASATVNAAKTTAVWVASAARTTAGWAVSFAAYLAGVAAATLATAQAAIRMAASWLLALGPIGLIIAVVVGLAALVIANWDTVKGWFASFWEWLKSAAVGAWNGVKNAFSGAVGFFANLWNSIINTFKAIGSTIGNAVGNAFKIAVNGILGFVDRTVNGIIDTINSAIHAIDNVTPGSLSRVSRISIPRLAEGGVVMPTPGGIIANIAEAGQPEAVIPLDRFDDLFGSNEGPTNEYHIREININDRTEGERWRRQLGLDQETTAQGLTPVKSYM